VTESISKQLIDAAQKWADAYWAQREEHHRGGRGGLYKLMTTQLHQTKQAFIELADSVNPKMRSETDYELNKWICEKQKQYNRMKELDDLYSRFIVAGDVGDLTVKIAALRKQLGFIK
jgi:hypothetical protein